MDERAFETGVFS